MTTSTNHTAYLLMPLVYVLRVVCRVDLTWKREAEINSIKHEV